MAERLGRPGTKYLGVDLPSADYDALKSAAEADGDRTVASLVRIIVSDWLTKNRRRPAKAVTA